MSLGPWRIWSHHVPFLSEREKLFHMQNEKFEVQPTEEINFIQKQSRFQWNIPIPYYGRLAEITVWDNHNNELKEPLFANQRADYHWFENIHTFGEGYEDRKKVFAIRFHTFERAGRARLFVERGSPFSFKKFLLHEDPEFSRKYAVLML